MNLIKPKTKLKIKFLIGNTGAKLSMKLHKSLVFGNNT